MSNAVVIISSETSYLEDKTAALGYDVYAFDEYTHKNLNKVSNIKYLKSFIKNISNQMHGSEIKDITPIMDGLRLIKSEAEIEVLKKTIELFELKIQEIQARNSNPLS